MDLCQSTLKLFCRLFMSFFSFFFRHPAYTRLWLIMLNEVACSKHCSGEEPKSQKAQCWQLDNDGNRAN